jgi:hypothetical protein
MEVEEEEEEEEEKEEKGGGQHVDSLIFVSAIDNS